MLLTNCFLGMQNEMDRISMPYLEDSSLFPIIP